MLDLKTLAYTLNFRLENPNLTLNFKPENPNLNF
jgi:hypothetical protein